MTETLGVRRVGLARLWIIALAGVISLALMALVMILFHQGAHVAVAKLLGDPTARMSLFKADGSKCWGCIEYDSTLHNNWANVAIIAAGVIVTQFFAWIAVLLLHRRPRGLMATWLLADVVFVCVAGDLLAQVMLTFQVGVPDRVELSHHAAYVDGSALIGFLHSATALPSGAIAVALLMLALVNVIAMALVLVNGFKSPYPYPAGRHR